jgi:glycosyltransferase involved in cell wall biosynthesis
MHAAAALDAAAHVNGKWLSRPLTGTGRYAQEVVRFLVADSVPLVLHVPRDGEVPAWLSERCAVVRHRSTGSLFEQVALPLTTRGRYLLNMGGPAPLLKRKQLVVMHDATPLRWPASYSRRFVAWYWVLDTWLARTATDVVTVSEFSRSELSSALALPSERWAIASCGHEHFADLPARRPELPPSFDAGKPFLVCVGTLALHKNLVGPATALARAGWQVLVVGTGGPSRVYASGVAADLPDNLTLLGRIDDEELAWCYDNALALVFPSRYEGFGLPVIEAQSRGCPVVSSDAASLPEVLGGSGLLFSPDDHEQLLRHVTRLLEDTVTRAALADAGRANVLRYRWSAAARTIAALIAAGRRRGPRLW